VITMFVSVPVAKVMSGPSTPLIVVVAPTPSAPAAAAIVTCPTVEVVMVMLLPATNVPTIQEVPEATRNWPFATGAVDVPVPPEEIPRGSVRVRDVAEIVVPDAAPK